MFCFALSGYGCPDSFEKKRRVSTQSRHGDDRKFAFFPMLKSISTVAVASKIGWLLSE
jgi:hypothetical protein